MKKNLQGPGKVMKTYKDKIIVLLSDFSKATYEQGSYKRNSIFLKLSERRC